MTTTAETIAARFDHNGQSFRDAAGEHITEIVGALPHRAHRFGDALVCEFADGSALAFCGNGWDVVARFGGAWRSVERDGSVNASGWTFGDPRTSLTDYADYLDMLTPDAIDHALAAGLTIGKYADPVEGARHDLTRDEAYAVMREDVGLLYVVGVA